MVCRASQRTSGSSVAAGFQVIAALSILPALFMARPLFSLPFKNLAE